MPYLFPWPNGTVSGGIKAQYDESSFNFIVAGGGANGGAFDHDDGSSFYLDHDNFEVYGGHKRCAAQRARASAAASRGARASARRLCGVLRGGLRAICWRILTQPFTPPPRRAAVTLTGTRSAHTITFTHTATCESPFARSRPRRAMQAPVALLAAAATPRRTAARRSTNAPPNRTVRYGTKCTGISNLPHAAPNDFFAEAYYNNKCVLAADAGYLELGGGCVPDATLANRIIIGNNSVFTPNASASISCGKTYTFAEWAALGLDAGSTVSTLPPAATIIGWARATLGLPAA